MMDTQENPTARKTASLMISYSRKDKVFVKQFYDRLVARGFAPGDIWVDWEGIPLSADWMAEITKGIQSADAFIFVISPDSAASDVCKKEIEIAVASNKRFIPILYREPGKEAKLHEKISSHNWVFIRDEQELEKTMPALVEAINTDLDWIAQHTRLFNRAKEWDAKGRNDSYLVRGNDLQDAETFITQGAAGKEPPPTTLHVDYVQAARKFAAAVRRRNRVISIVVGVALFGLSIFALIQRGAAIESRDIALTAQVVAQENETKAKAAEAEAQKQREAAEKNEAEARIKERVATAHVLAAEAINQKYSDTQLSLILALLSIQETELDGTILTEAKSALFSSLNTPNVLHTWDNNGAIVWETAYDPTGIYVAIGDDVGLVQVFNVESRELVYSLPPFEGRISGLDFSPDGKRLAISSFDTTAKVINAETGEELFSLAGHDGNLINDIDFSPDGNLIATAGGDTLVKIWYGDNGSLKVSLYGHTSEVTSVDFGPDGTRLISGSYDDTAIMWDMENSALLFTLRPDGPETGANTINSVAFSSNGNRVITGGYKTVVLWDALTNTEIQRLNGNQATVYDVDFAPDNSSMTTSSSGIKVWDWVYGTERFNLSSHHGEVNSVAYNSDGSQMITGSWDYTAKLWAANLKIETLRLKQHNAPNTDAGYSLDGKYIFTIGDAGVVLIHNAETGEVVDELFGYSASFDPQDSQRIVTVDGTNANVWIIGQDEPVRVISSEEVGIQSAAFSPDGKQILSIDGNGVFKIWDVEDENASSVVDGYDGSPIVDAWFGADGNYILTRSGNSAGIWDLKNIGKGPIYLEGHTDLVLTAVFSHDGKYVYTGSYDNTIRKWDAKTGEMFLVMTGHTGRIFDLDVSPDNTLVASASADTTVRVWDAETGKEIYKYEGNNEDAYSVAFSPDGKKVLTASADKISKEFTIDFDRLLQIAQEYELRQLTKEECLRYLKRANCNLHLANAVTSPSAQPGVPESGSGEAPSLTSGDGTAPVTLVFENNTESDVNVFWIDFDGLERLYFSAAPGDIIEQGTYSTHVWRVRDFDGNILVDYIATDDPKQTLDISGSGEPSAAQPETAVATEIPSSGTGSFYTEEFNENLGSSWNSFMATGTGNQVDTSIDGERLFVQLSPDEDKIPRFYLVNNAAEYSSVQLEVVTTNNGNNANGISLVCNYDGNYWYEFTISNAGLYSIRAYDPGATALQGYIELATGGSAAIKTGPATNVYRAICNGSELTLYINDTMTKTLVDTAYNLTSGKIGIGVSSPQTLPVDVSFESLTVSEP